ncbi:MAG TPA: AI-2E family transporter [Ilumatobacteraceae bacterium]|nr:AI-2E family transporter [Ilumatobacteraceae bacterium]
MPNQSADSASGAPPVTGSSPSTARAEIVLITVIGVAILGAMAVLAVFRSASRELTALGIGLLLALALDPVLRATQRRFECSRAVGTVIVGTACVVAFGGVVLVLGSQATDQAGKFAEELPATIEEFYTWPVIGQRLEDADAVGDVERFADELPTRIDADLISDVAGRVLGGLGSALLVLVVAVAVLLDGEALVARVRRAIPPERRERADEVGRIVYRSVARYFAGSVAVAILNGTVILTSGLILGIPLAPLAAVWAAITNLIPQIGGFLGGSFFVLLALTQGALPGLIALVIFLGYQQLENNVIQPTVIGRAINLTPPTTMLAALVGAAAAGVPGALVAAPMIGAAKSVWLDTRGQGSASPDEPPAHTRTTRLRQVMNRVSRSTDG